MQVPDEVKLILEGLTLVGSMALVMTRLGRLGERFENHGQKLDKLESAMEKMEGVLQVVSVQKDQIQSLRELVLTNKQEQNSTNERMFRILDSLRKPA